MFYRGQLTEFVRQRWTHCARHRDGCAGDTGRIGVGRPFCPVLPAATRPVHDTFHLGRSLNSFPCNIIFSTVAAAQLCWTRCPGRPLGPWRPARATSHRKSCKMSYQKPWSPPRPIVSMTSSRAAFSLILLAGSRGEVGRLVDFFGLPSENVRRFYSVNGSTRPRRSRFSVCT